MNQSKPKQQIQLFISCKNLADRDTFSKSDPYVHVFENSRSIGKTETIQNDLNPHFSTPITINYQFEVRQMLRFVVKDSDDGSSDDHLGEITVPLGQIISFCEPGSDGFTKKLDRVNKGTITIKPVEVSGSGNKVVRISASAQKVDKMDWFGKSDPFYEIFCGNVMVYRSEVVMNNLSPNWKQGQFPYSLLEGSGNSFTVKVYDWDKNSDNHDLIGETTIGQILELQGTKHAIINKQKSYKSKKPHSGLFIINNFEVITPKTFLQYIQQDQVRLNFNCAIDFTGSNGDPKFPNSLHYKSPQRRSQYTDALAPICLIVQDYDSDKIVPAYGFGAKLPDGTVSHHFPLNINTGEAEMFSLDQILENYWNCVERVTLWGPTNFAPTIRTAVSQSLNSNGKDYSVLLILTDGAITDMSETIKEIEKAQHAPISIIIVGVGTADFSSMELLDGDSGDSKFSKVRDCVQFCSYKEVENHFPQGSLMTPDGFQQMKAMLAAKVLEELPKQLEEYFKMKGL